MPRSSLGCHPNKMSHTSVAYCAYSSPKNFIRMLTKQLRRNYIQALSLETPAHFTGDNKKRVSDARSAVARRIFLSRRLAPVSMITLGVSETQ